MSGLLGLLERQGRQALCSTTGRSFATSAAQVFDRDVSPILGEVSKTAMSSGRSFWLDVDQKIVPEQYRYDSLPSHVKELPILFAAFRKTLAVPEQGTWASKQLRGSGFVPALLDSLPHKQAPQRLVVPVAQITTAFEQFGATFTNALFLLQIVPMDDLAAFNMPAEDYAAIVAKGWKPTPLHTFQVLPRRLSYNLVRNELQALTFLNSPSTRIVESRVPVIAENDDESPCAKKGGFALVTRKAVQVRSLAINVPLYIGIDCETFDTHEKVFARDVEMPRGQVMVQPADDTCLLRMEPGGR